MNRFAWLMFGFFLTFTSSWLGLVAIPNFQIGGIKPFEDKDTGALYPSAPSGSAEAGKIVYQANGCVYCHSQQIRPGHQGSDLARGWGSRRTVARDYIYDKPHLLGTMRTGPDLTNIGARQKDEAWHHKHLYAPAVVSPGSIMPPFAFLYEKRKIKGEPSPDALKFDPPLAPEPGYEIVPTKEAKDLVAYLISLDRTYTLPEAPEK